MKKLTLFIILFLFLATGCSTMKPYSNNESNHSPQTKVAKEVPLDFTVEKTVLSKGYFSLNPNVKVLDKSDNPPLLITLGGVECSGVAVEKVTSFNNEINIYISKLSNGEDTIVIPQITLKLLNMDKEKMTNSKIHIIGTNYSPIDINYDLNQVLNTMYAHFKVYCNTSPHVSIQKNNDQILWDITLHNAFDKLLPGSPLVNLSASVDASSGAIVESHKTIISEYIDEGTILHTSQKGLLFYKKIMDNNDVSFESLWFYDGIEEKQLYSTSHTIDSVTYNPQSKTVALLEQNEGITDLYLIFMEDMTVQRITPINYNQTRDMVWDENNLYFANYDQNKGTTIFKYNISKNKWSELFSLKMNVVDFDVHDGRFIFETFNDGHDGSLYLATDEKDLERIAAGQNCQFIDDEHIAYTTTSSNNNNVLWLYNSQSNDKTPVYEGTISDFTPIDKNTWIICEENKYGSEYVVVKYTLDDKHRTILAQTISENIFYLNEDSLYLYTSPPEDTGMKNHVYKISLDKVSTE